MNKVKMAACLATLLCPIMSLAEVSEKSISYSYLDLGFQQIKTTSDPKIKADGPLIGGSIELGSNAFVKLGYSTLETEKLYLYDGIDIYTGTFELSNISIGAGGYYPIKENIHFVGELNLVRAETKGKGEFSMLETERDNGWSVGLGIRAMATNWLELSAGLQHGDIYEDSDTGLVLGTRFHFNKLFSIGLNYVKYSEEDQLAAAVRFSF